MISLRIMGHQGDAEVHIYSCHALCFIEMHRNCQKLKLVVGVSNPMTRPQRCSGFVHKKVLGLIDNMSIRTITYFFRVIVTDLLLVHKF